MSTQKKPGPYHVSNYVNGKYKDGMWYCNHSDRASEGAGRSSPYWQMPLWSCDRSIHPDKCSFFLWEDHLVEALKYHEVPEDQIIKATPKRKRDGDIRELLLRSPKTPRTREPRAEDGEEDDLYGSPSPSPSPSPRSRQGEESNRRRDESPTPMPGRAARAMERANAPSPSSRATPSEKEEYDVVEPLPPIWSAAWKRMHPQGPGTSSQDTSFQSLGSLGSEPLSPEATPPQPRVPQRSSPPPWLPASAFALAPPPVIEPRTPSRNAIGKEPVRDVSGVMPSMSVPVTPSTSRKRLSTPELEAYNGCIKALTGCNVKLSLKGQNLLRDLIKEETYLLEP